MNKRFTIIAGPCSLETKSQSITTAKAIKEIAPLAIYRGGVWKPRTRPGFFEGHKIQALEWLRDIQREVGLTCSTEVANALHVEQALAFEINTFWIGARTTVSPFAIQEIADALRGTNATVYIKNPVSPDIQLWLGAIERIEQSVSNVSAIHRGFTPFEMSEYRNEPVWRIPMELKRLRPELEILCDPSHIAGKRNYIKEITNKAVSLGFDGLMIETHIDPDTAISDAQQQITPSDLNKLLQQLPVKTLQTSRDVLTDYRYNIDMLDASLLDILKQRLDMSVLIGQEKKENGIQIFQPDRYNSMLQRLHVLAERKGLPISYVDALFEIIHEQSVNVQ